MVQNLPKITVITPCLNRVGFVRYCIESVISQNYLNIEHIFVDGGSTDGTLDILNQFPHLKIIVQKSCTGEATNIGIQEAKGDIICFLNTDDVFCENTFKNVVNAFKISPQSEIVCGRYIVINEQGNFLELSPYLKQRLTPFSIGFFPPGINALFFKKSVFGQVGLFDVSYKRAIDRDFLLRCFFAMIPYISINVNFIRYVQHADSFTLNEDVFFNELIIKEHFRLIRKNLNLAQTKKKHYVFKAWLCLEQIRYFLTICNKGHYWEGLKQFASIFKENITTLYLCYFFIFYVRKKLIQKEWLKI